MANDLPAAATTDDYPVFLIEDDAVVRKGYAQALSIAGIPVRAFADAESAFAALPGCLPGAVVSDVRLPGRDGLAVLREMRQHDRELPVVLVTGHGDVAMAVDAMRLGANASVLAAILRFGVVAPGIDRIS